MGSVADLMEAVSDQWMNMMPTATIAKSIKGATAKAVTGSKQVRIASLKQWWKCKVWGKSESDGKLLVLGLTRRCEFF